MADAIVPTLHQLCSQHFASQIRNNQIPPIKCSLPVQIGDKIFNALRELGGLNEKSLATFTQVPLQISRFDSSGCDLFSLEGLSLLKKFRNLLSINLASSSSENVSEEKFDVAAFIRRCLSPESLKTLRHLNLGGTGELSCLHPLAAINHLESLILINRPICQRWMVEADFFGANLRMIDITGTCITDISWLMSLRKLEVLIMHNVKVRTGCVHKTLSSLPCLRVLDISKKVTDFAGDGSQESHVDLALAVVHILSHWNACPWPELRAIDISGNSLAGRGIDQAIRIVDTIVVKCPRLEKVSVMATPLDGHSYVTPVNRPLTIVNCATRQDAIDALHEYWDTDREVFTSHALHAVYYCLQSSYDDFSDAEIKESSRIVCKAMKRHLKNIGVQMAGSACLYHLCKMKRIRRLGVSDVQECMERCLDAAETYRNMVQLQKNVWLTICNDYLLQLPGVDFYRTCKVALESMLSSRDASVARMTIAIVSIVTPKMRPPEARELTGDERYVRHLVLLMNDNLRLILNTPGPRPETSVFTLKFTLSALWNLTDESSSTCEVFFDAGGVLTCFEILTIFSTHYNIQTKVLGILNNVAEVPALQKEIIDRERWLQTLCDCLIGDFRNRDDSGRNRSVERSYFAAGVLTNILICPTWNKTHKRITKSYINEKLAEAITSWPDLQSAMVSYRSFLPFERILEETTFYGAQMWCLWGINHVLSHREKNAAAMDYHSMLCQSKIPAICQEMAENPKSNSAIRFLASQILFFHVKGPQIMEANDMECTKAS